MSVISRSLLVLCAVLLGACELTLPYFPTPPPAEVEDRSPPVSEDAGLELRTVVVRPEQFEAVRTSRKIVLARQDETALPAADRGFYLDIQEARLRQELSGSNVEILRADGTIVLTFPDNVAFDTGSTRIRDETRLLLDRAAPVFLEFDKTLISILGHTDNSGAEDMNQSLSEQRGMSVARYLLERGMPLDRLLVVGYGEATPIADNETETGRDRNRRIELILEPVVR